MAKLKPWLIGTLAVYWLVIFWSTHTPKPPQTGLPSDKWEHYFAYSGLAFLLGMVLAGRKPFTRWSALRIFFIVAAYGIVDELLQIPVGRDADIMDWRADLIGAATGVLLFWACYAIYQKKRGTAKEVPPG